MKEDLWVIGLHLKCGRWELYYWSAEKLSNKRLRRLLRRWINEPDVEAVGQRPWDRFYFTKAEAKKALSPL